MTTISVIVGSTRQGRFSEKPAQWILQHLQKRDGIEARLLDLRDLPMPFFDQPLPPAMPGRAPYEDEVVKRWTAEIAASDGFVFVTPEYNYGTSAMLKNAIDWVYPEWNRKAAAFISYGSAMGARAVQQLRENMIEVQIAPVRSSVHIPVATLWAHFQAGDVEKGLAEHIPDVRAGLPSALLERRPDIRAAEQALIAANANIGVAKAAYFPQITLTGSIGGQSSKLSNLFSGPNGTWSFVPQLTQPIFTAGRLRSNVRLAEAQRDQALVAYERSIQTAFSDVSNALIAHQRTRETRLEQERLVATLEDRKRLAYVRYQGGVDTQLNALDADRDLFATELTLAQVRYSELVSVVQLYKALGGGWQ